MTEDIRENGSSIKPKVPRKRRMRLFVTIFILLLLAGVVVAYWYMYMRGVIGTDDAFIDADPTTISSKMLGRVALLTVDEGDSVTSGQLLVKLDDSDLKAQEAQAQAGLEYVRKNVEVARVSLERVQQDFDRASLQYNDKVITREQYDHTAKALELAQVQYKAALSQVSSSEAQLHVIETQLGNTVITTPTSGVIARRWVMPGDIVQAGQPIYTLYDLQSVWVTANYEETKLSSVNIGDSVRIKVDAYPDREYSGKVVLIGSAAASQFSLIPPNNASGNFTKVTQRFPVKISIDPIRYDDAGEVAPLLPGMSVEVVIRVMER
jgi:membrane fusion protein (multidrug efflux system)